MRKNRKTIEIIILKKSIGKKGVKDENSNLLEFFFLISNVVYIKKAQCASRYTRKARSASEYT